ncbi:CaiB/BaiF CoA transferase family protein [Achromobacter sp.]|uniref:CaiB/BaiF CoA transferase family protein n=1 Tax=Achromobacter sp. TaxID=134375 RepID=UPI003C7684AA
MKTPTSADSTPAFQGLTVLDLSQGIAGPYCGLILGQQGARVIKVEPPDGDWARQMGRARDGLSAIAVAYNAGKQSVMLDARTDEGRRAIRGLAARADVVIQSFRPGVAERMNMGYESLAAANPALVYVSISGYGADGPLAHLPAVDTTMQAYGGLMQANRDTAGQPRRIGLLLIDLSTGLYAAQAAAAALHGAARSGAGRHVQVSMLEASAALQSYLLLDQAMFPDEEPVGLNAPTGQFQTQTGLGYMAMLNDAMFLRLADALGFDDWRQDTVLHSTAGRLGRAAELSARVAAALACESLAHWEAVFRRHDILFSRVGGVEDLLDCPQSRHAGLFVELEQGALGSLPWVRLPGVPVASGSPAAAPRTGEHTQAVLTEFGL